jgi:predicted TIM-barrel fold metal-dependent hydrolase
MPYVDTHAHVFLTTLPMAAGRRYTPQRDCPTEAYLGVLAAHDVGYGVLVQPSFLGTDNSYMLEALERYPARLRGIAVVDPSISEAELERMHQAGVIGIRFNMIGKDIAELTSGPVAGLLRRIDQLGWQVEVQAKGADLARVFSAMDRFGGPLVIDHFGLPDPLLGVRDPGFRALLAEGSNGRTFVKMSAGYRCHGLDVAGCAGALMAVLGPRRLLWGSDWPFTQFEAIADFGGMVKEFLRWVPDRSARDAIDQTAMGLFNFSNELNALTLGRADRRAASAA